MNDKIKPVSPRNTVEVHLPDGHVLSGPRGASAGDFLGTDAKSGSAPLVGAIVNDELRELTYPIKMDCKLSPVTVAAGTSGVAPFGKPVQPVHVSEARLYHL